MERVNRLLGRSATERAARGSALLALIAVAALLAATWIGRSPSGALYRTTLPEGNHASGMAVVLGDQTGLVTAIEPASNWIDGEPDDQAQADGGRSLLVRWDNHGCDADSVLAFDRSPSGYRLDIRLDSGFAVNNCGWLCVVEALRIRFSEAVPPASITVKRDGSPCG